MEGATAVGCRKFGELLLEALQERRIAAIE